MTLPDRKVYIYEQYSEEFTNNFIKSIEVLSQKAEEKNVILSIENSSNFGKLFIQKTLDKAITYPNIKLTWDTGHDAVSSFTDKKYLMENEKSIAHMHIHDCVGKKDHQVLFEGELDIMKLMSFADTKDIRALVEVKTAEALEKSIYSLREKMK
jgi:sugar phosphate isomerase/epimerase